MIEALSGFPSTILAFHCKAPVTKTDYEAVVIPAVEQQAKRQEKLRLYYEIDAGLRDFEAGAMWDDFKVGVEHLRHWERIAVVSDVNWIRHAVELFRFVIPGTVKSFPKAEAAKARQWIGEN